jgi:hypothetical protein
MKIEEYNKIREAIVDVVVRRQLSNISYSKMLLKFVLLALPGKRQTGMGEKCLKIYLAKRRSKSISWHKTNSASMEFSQGY